MERIDNKFQVIWGIMLVLAGLGVFYRIPQVMPEIKQIEQFSSVIYFIQFCFYLMGVILIGGGAKKIFNFFSNKNESERTPNLKK